MTDKPPSISQLKRKIQRLEARNAELEAKLDKQAAVIREHIYDTVDAKIRIEQAMAILSGEEK